MLVTFTTRAETSPVSPSLCFLGHHTIITVRLPLLTVPVEHCAIPEPGVPDVGHNQTQDVKVHTVDHGITQSPLGTAIILL